MGQSVRSGDGSEPQTWLELVRSLIYAQVGDPELVARRYEQLVGAASRLLHERGFERTTIHDIAGAVGLSVGAIYKYVEEKEQVLLLILARALWRFHEAVRPVLDAPETPVDKLRRAIELYFRTMAEQSEAVLLAYQESRVLKDRYAELVKELERRTNAVFEGILREGVASGVVRPLRVELAAYNIIMLAHMWALKRWYLGRHLDLDTYIQEQTEFLLAAMLRDAGGADFRAADDERAGT